jgi:hypothetical protein
MLSCCHISYTVFQPTGWDISSKRKITQSRLSKNFGRFKKLLAYGVCGSCVVHVWAPPPLFYVFLECRYWRCLLIKSRHKKVSQNRYEGRPSPLHLLFKCSQIVVHLYLRTVRLAQHYSKMPQNPFAGNFLCTHVFLDCVLYCVHPAFSLLNPRLDSGHFVAEKLWRLEAELDHIPSRTHPQHFPPPLSALSPCHLRVQKVFLFLYLYRHTMK